MSDPAHDSDESGCWAAGEAESAAAAKPIVLVAAVALIDADGRVLLARRPRGKAMAGLWEFPGGKLRAGETPERALIRELDEELGIDTRQSCLAPIAFAASVALVTPGLPGASVSLSAAITISRS